MRTGKPSGTALVVARHRAVHQILEHGCIFRDPLAMQILGEDPQTVIREAEEQPYGERSRRFIAARQRLAEDTLLQAVENGVSQLVILGAGLDTFAYRSPFGDRLRIFEVDHPLTQAWKRQRLVQAEIPVPNWLTFVPIDFEHETLSDRLAFMGFDFKQLTFFTWLGVVVYLTEPAIWATLDYIASLPNGAHVMFDYSNSPDSYSQRARAAYDMRANGAAKWGETFVTHFETQTIHDKLKSVGYSRIEDFGPQQIAERFYPESANSVSKKGSHVLHASTH